MDHVLYANCTNEYFYFGDLSYLYNHLVYSAHSAFSDLLSLKVSKAESMILCSKIYWRDRKIFHLHVNSSQACQSQDWARSQKL